MAHDYRFGYVDFKNKAAVKEALKLDAKVFKGRALVIDIDHAKPKEGFKYRGSDENRKFYRQYAYFTLRDEKRKLNEDIINLKKAKKTNIQDYEPDYD